MKVTNCSFKFRLVVAFPLQDGLLVLHFGLVLPCQTWAGNLTRVFTVSPGQRLRFTSFLNPLRTINNLQRRAWVFFLFSWTLVESWRRCSNRSDLQTGSGSNEAVKSNAHIHLCLYQYLINIWEGSVYFWSCMFDFDLMWIRENLFLCWWWLEVNFCLTLKCVGKPLKMWENTW